MWPKCLSFLYLARNFLFTLILFFKEKHREKILNNLVHCLCFASTLIEKLKKQKYHYFIQFFSLSFVSCTEMFHIDLRTIYSAWQQSRGQNWNIHFCKLKPMCIWCWRSKGYKHKLALEIVFPQVTPVPLHLFFALRVIFKKKKKIVNIYVTIFTTKLLLQT